MEDYLENFFADFSKKIEPERVRNLEVLSLARDFNSYILDQIEEKTHRKSDRPVEFKNPFPYSRLNIKSITSTESLTEDLRLILGRKVLSSLEIDEGVHFLLIDFGFSQGNIWCKVFPSKDGTASLDSYIPPENSPAMLFNTGEESIDCVFSQGSSIKFLSFFKDVNSFYSNGEFVLEFKGDFRNPFNSKVYLA